VSARLSSTDEFYAERPMYFSYKQGVPGYSWTGGHCATGAPSPRSDWYFAEGTTRAGFEEWICIQNPGVADVTVGLDYVSAGAYTQHKDYNIPAKSRISVFVNGDVGPEQDVSTYVHCDSPIVAERPMYFNYHGKWPGGHVIMGTGSPKTAWYFAEGTTRPGFEEYLAVQNASNTDATLTVHFLKSDGTQQVEEYTVGANSRWTLDVSQAVGVGVDSSITVESNQPVVAERPMYFNYNGVWPGGHDVVGATAPKTSWFFAEGGRYRRQGPGRLHRGALGQAGGCRASHVLQLQKQVDRRARRGGVLTAGVIGFSPGPGIVLCRVRLKAGAVKRWPA
jgi:hypothetical protein